MQNPDFAKDWGSKYPLKTYGYDPARANQILDAAGWTRGSDSVRTRNGVRLSFEYATTSDNIHQQIATLVQTDLRKVGMDARLRNVPATYYFARDGYLAKRELDFAEFVRTLDADPSGSAGSPAYDSANIPTAANGFGGLNYAGGVRRPVETGVARRRGVDGLPVWANAEVDRGKRAPLFAEMQQIFAEDLPALPLYVQARIEVHKANLVNWDTSGGPTQPTYKAAAMYFK